MLVAVEAVAAEAGLLQNKPELVSITSRKISQSEPCHDETESLAFFDLLFNLNLFKNKMNSNSNPICDRTKAITVA